MITALAVETLLVSVLALLSLKASVTLAALVTVIWLPLALLSVWRSAWAWMTLAMIAMLWRAEAWKTVCLAEEAQLSQCLQSLPKTASIWRRALVDHAVADSVQPQALRPFLAEELQEACQFRKARFRTWLIDQIEPDREHHKGPEEPQVLDSGGSLAASRLERDLIPLEPRLWSQMDFSLFDLPRLGQSHPIGPNTEYLIIDESKTVIYDWTLKNYGERGYELIAILPGCRPQEARWVFKRPRP